MKFKSPTATPVFLALTSGHTAVVGPEFEELDARFHREAIANGCLPAGAKEEPPLEGATPGFDRRKVIADAMNLMLDGAVEGDFTADGKPDVRKLSAKVGFSVDRHERDMVFAEITK